MNKELDAAKRIIINHLHTNLNPDSVSSIYDIQSGNKEILLSHIDACIGIFNTAKEQLEEEMKENDRRE